MAIATPAPIAVAPAARREQRRALAVGCGAHALHDGYTDLIYVLLPIWQAEFALPYAAIGIMRAAFTATMAAFQLPAGMLAERIGPPAVLAGGTALAASCFCLAGFSSGLASIVAVLVLGGLGASTQHPLASALVTRTFAGARSLAAFGTYNFAGDIGKMVVPVTATLMIAVMPWRVAVSALGALGFLAALAFFLAMPRFVAESVETNAATASPADVPAPRRGFFLLLAIGMIDSVTRSGFLIFLPFILLGKGASLQTVGFAFTLVFAGGATGKLVCGHIGARVGIIGTVFVTEAFTAIGMLVLLVVPIELALILLPPIGVAVNGTSSVLYGSVPEFTTAAGRARAFGIFYTGALGAGAAGPVLFGAIGDRLGMPVALMIDAGLVLTTLPVAWFLRSAFRSKT